MQHLAFEAPSGILGSTLASWEGEAADRRCRLQHAFVQKIRHGWQSLASFRAGGTMTLMLGCVRRGHEVAGEGRFVEGLRPFYELARTHKVKASGGWKVGPACRWHQHGGLQDEVLEP